MGEGTEVTIPSGSTSADLEDLDLVTAYDVYIKTICTDGESIYTVPMTFTTKDIYCEIEAMEVIEPITYVEFAGIENTSGAELDAHPGHEYFLNQTAQVSLDSSYAIAVEGNTDVGYTDAITAFIDWNQDGIFNNTSERYDVGLIENSTGTDGIQAVSSIEVPNNALLGTTRLRIVKEFYFNEYPIDGCTWVSYGQIEEYSVEVSSPTGIAEFSKFNFTYGPNPTKDNIRLNAEISINKVKIYNLMGQKVFEKQVNSNSSQINISALSSGIYFMEVTIDGERKTIKILKD